MPDATAANGKEAAYFGVPWEDAYGYAQAIKIGNTIHVSGQLSHDDKANLVAPAALDESGKPSEISMMEQQMRTSYANAGQCRHAASALRRDAGHVVEETLYILDVDARRLPLRQSAQGSLWHGAASVRQHYDRRIEAGLS